MMRGLFQLTWLEIKIFLREPLGAIGTLLIPVALFLIVGRAMNRGTGAAATPGGLEFMQSGLPVMASVFMAISAVISLVTIISIYREGGILKRLRATPLRPHTILSAHVLVEAAVHRGDADADDAGRPPLLPGRPAGAGGQLCDRAARSARCRSCRSDS